MKTYKPQHIVIYGTSAGAILTAEVAAKLKQLGLPLPAALGIFSGFGDFARPGDSLAMYGLRGLAGHLDPPRPEGHNLEYPGTTDLKDPVLSPIYGDMRGLPPTLFVTSGRDLLLSGTIKSASRLSASREWMRGSLCMTRCLMPSGTTRALPEAIEANHLMADFFVKQLGK